MKLKRVLVVTICVVMVRCLAGWSFILADEIESETQAVQNDAVPGVSAPVRDQLAPKSAEQVSRQMLERARQLSRPPVSGNTHQRPSKQFPSQPLPPPTSRNQPKRFDWDSAMVVMVIAGPLAFLLGFILLAILLRLRQIEEVLRETNGTLENFFSEYLKTVVASPIEHEPRQTKTAQPLTPDLLDTTPVEIVDSQLEQVLRKALSKPSGALTRADLATIQLLEAHESQVADLAGLEHCQHLTMVNLTRNQVTDLTPLMELVCLEKLYLSHNPLNDNALEQIKQLRARGVSVVKL